MVASSLGLPVLPKRKMTGNRDASDQIVRRLSVREIRKMGSLLSQTYLLLTIEGAALRPSLTQWSTPSFAFLIL